MGTLVRHGAMSSRFGPWFSGSCFITPNEFMTNERPGRSFVDCFCVKAASTSTEVLASSFPVRCRWKPRTLVVDTYQEKQKQHVATPADDSCGETLTAGSRHPKHTIKAKLSRYPGSQPKASWVPFVRFYSNPVWFGQVALVCTARIEAS